jgi:Cu/Ag efflux pump CusA
MVLLFLRDVRSALLSYSPSRLRYSQRSSAWLAGQTVSIMTLGGLALAIGILVDEATVAIENIHVHLARAAEDEGRL